jgi:uncharacterized protein YkwD
LKRLRLLLTLTLLCALAAAAAPPQSSAARAERGDRMMDAINYVRAKAGLRPLRRSRRLVRASAARAEYMMRRDFFEHPSYLRVPSFDRVGEVLELHRGRRPRTNRTLRLWGGSSGHRAVILSSRYRWVGAARAVGRYRGVRATMWVVRFGKH